MQIGKNIVLYKKLIAFSFSLIVGCLIVIIVCDKKISSSAEGKHYSSLASIPYNKVGLLLGTSKKVGSRDNLYYINRINAAYNLMKAGKIKYIIISGDNGREDYNEPGMMRADLINRGIDSSKIYLDYAGFRTFDSVKKLKEIFGQNAVTIISQPFHNERAIYIAERENIAAIGFDAKDPSFRGSIKTKIREKFARVKVFLDFWFNAKPKFLGDTIKIPD